MAGPAAVPNPRALAATLSDPVLIGGCAGWLHRPAQGGGGVAVVLCPAIGWDGLHAYHGQRVLADQLAAMGYPTLRFQYRGTGDSADMPAGAEHWAEWQADANRAADWLRQTTGAGRVVLAGLRLGAMVAAAVSTGRDDVAALALLAPVLRGKSYLRQLDMEARLEGGIGTEQGEGLDFHEFSFSRATVDTLGAIDLRKTALRPGMPVALFPQAPSNLVDGCIRAWRTAGVAVELRDFAGMLPLLQEAIHVDPPPSEFGQLLDWITTVVPLGTVPAALAAAPLPPPVLTLPGCTESTIRFGDGLAGVLCVPAGGPTPFAVLIGNTGRDPHFGIARFGVDFARLLARDGVASLRMDFAGLGDSPVRGGVDGELSKLFELDRTADLAAGVGALRGAGFSHIVAQGLCSGAFHAFQAAKADDRISGLILVNLPLFEWQGGDTVREARWKAAPPHRVLGKLLEPRVWQRVLTGQSPLAGILRGQLHRALGKITGRSRLVGATPAAAMNTLADRGVRSLFLYSSIDPGLDPLAMAFGPDGAGLREVRSVDLRIVPGIDHVLSGRHMREEAVQHMLAFLRAQILPGGAASRSIPHDHPIDHPRPNDPGGAAAAPHARAVA